MPSCGSHPNKQIVFIIMAGEAGSIPCQQFVYLPPFSRSGCKRKETKGGSFFCKKNQICKQIKHTVTKKMPIVLPIICPTAWQTHFDISIASSANNDSHLFGADKLNVFAVLQQHPAIELRYVCQSVTAYIAAAGCNHSCKGNIAKQLRNNNRACNTFTTTAIKQMQLRLQTNRNKCPAVGRTRTNKLFLL